MKFSNAEKRINDAESKNKLSISHWRGNLHGHSQTDISQPEKTSDIYENRKGSNCGQIPLFILATYYEQEMKNEYLAITEHSRDSDPQASIEGINNWFLEMYLQNSKWLEINFCKTREDLKFEDIEKIKMLAIQEAKKLTHYGDERLLDIITDIEQWRGGIRILKGVEANLLPNGEFDSDMVRRGEFEIVNCSIHPRLNPEEYQAIISDPSEYKNLIIKGIQNPKTNIICHIGYGLKKRVFDSLDWDSIFVAANESKVAVEINLKNVLSFLYKDILDENKYPKSDLSYLADFKNELPRLLPILNNQVALAAFKKHIGQGLKLAINSDEHKNVFINTEVSKQKINYNFKERGIRFWRCMKELENYFNRVFTELGVKKENIINTYTQEELEKFLKKQI
jgi:histidinol phosphatase-like PHP family hydrolase